MATSHGFRSDLRAEVGIGTMIVFIATILVAAIAAGVLISTSQKLQAKSTQTGNEATQNVVGSFVVLQIVGVRSGTTANDPIDQLDLTIQLASGADPVDLATLLIPINDEQTEVTIDTCVQGGVVTQNTEFAMTVARGQASDCGFIVSGDLVYLHLGLAGGTPIQVIPGGIAENARIHLQIIPMHGASVLTSFVVPALGSTRTVSLF